MQNKITPRQQGHAKMTPEFVKNVVKHMQRMGQIPCDSTEEAIKSMEVELEKMDPVNNEHSIKEYELEHIPECPICGAERFEDIEHSCRNCYSKTDKEICLNNKGYCPGCFMEINDGLSEIIEYKKELGVKCKCMRFYCAKCLGLNCKDEDCPIHTSEAKNEYRQKIKAVEGGYNIPAAKEFRKSLETKVFERPEPGEDMSWRDKFFKMIVTSNIERAKKNAEAKIIELEETIKWIRSMITKSELDTETGSNSKLKNLKNPKSPTAQRLQKRIEKPLIEHLQKIGQIK